MKIKKKKKEDRKQIIPLLEQVSRLHIKRRADIFKTKKYQDIDKYALELISNKEKITFVAEQENKILGIIVLKIKEVKNHINLKDSKTLWVDELCVNKENRGEGIGKQLINKAKEIAKELNCIRLELNCWEMNKEATAFYEKQGMQTQRRIMELKL